MLRISSLLLFLLGVIGWYSPCLGESVQDLELPGAVKTEVVFPYVAWGSLEGFFHITELILINPNEEDLHYEFLLFESDGHLAKEFLESYANVAGIPGVLLEDGKVWGVVPGNYVDSWGLSPWDIEGGLFSGWVLLRADKEIQAHLRYTVLDLTENFELQTVSLTDLTANYQGVHSAVYRVEADKCEGYSDFRDADGKKQKLWEITNTGVSLVNPGDSPLSVELRLQAHNEEEVRELELAPKTQQTFVVSDFFESISADECTFSGRLEITADNDSLSVTALDVEVRQMPNGGYCPDSLCRIPYWYERPHGLEFQWGQHFDFPEEILEAATIGDFEAYLTPFGVILVDSGGEVDGVHPFAYGSGGFFHVEEHGFSLVWGRLNTPFIFGGTGKVIVADRAQFYSDSIDVLPGETEGQVIVTQQAMCYSPIITIDLETQEIVSVRQRSCF